MQQGWQWRHFGLYCRKARPRRTRRFQCLHCDVTFSCQTFSVTYWLKRETIAKAKRRNCSTYRLAIFLVMCNFGNGKRVRGCRQTPAQLLGVCRERLTAGEVIARRLIVAQVGLEGRWRPNYWQEVETRALKINRRRRLTYAA